MSNLPEKKNPYRLGEVQFGRPKEYESDEERKVRSIRYTDTQIILIKEKYSTLQDFAEDAFDVLIQGL